MDKKKITEDFIEASFLLGKELLNKEELTELEKNFLKHLDKISELF